jgi:hypothetical protein
MTDTTRLALLEALATRVRIWCASRSDLDGDGETLDDTQALFDAIAALDAALDALLTALAADGYAVVPVVPTEAMCIAGEECIARNECCLLAEDVYFAMRTAAR